MCEGSLMSLLETTCTRLLHKVSRQCRSRAVHVQTYNIIITVYMNTNFHIVASYKQKACMLNLYHKSYRKHTATTQLFPYDGVCIIMNNNLLTSHLSR